MNKVAIMSWYSYQNYGTVLQALALNRAVSSLGYSVRHIAYDPEPAQRVNRGSSTSLRAKVFSKCKRAMGWSPIESRERAYAFNSFINKNIPLTPACDTESLCRLNEHYDAFICGSDQIWSPRCFDPHFFLDFVSNRQRKIAYAPSFGCENIYDDSIRNKVGELINDFAHVSVREASGARLVRSLTGITPEIVADPTLLLCERQWRAYAGKEYAGDCEYCLLYFLGDEKRNTAIARKVAKRRGLRTLVIPVHNIQTKDNDSVGTNIGPAEFISLIQNASLVCTDSFHGMVFAVIFNKSFIPFERFDPKKPSSQNTRVYSFLEMLNCSNLLLSRDGLCNWEEYANPCIDYSRLNEIVAEGRAHSMQYLSEALNQATAIG